MFYLHWHEIKKEIFTILFLSGIHIWLCFTYPLYNRLIFPWNYIIILSMCIVGIVFYVYAFSNPEKYAINIDLEILDNLPYSHIMRTIAVTMIILCYFLAMFITLRVNFWRIQPLYNYLVFGYMFLVFALLSRAKNVQKRDEIH
jgi:hypothetical protein